MHSYQTQTAHFFHNGDFSGDVEIIDIGGDSVWVSMDSLKGFMAYYLRCQQISRLENASADEILGD